jgi:hypothetical protein
MCRRDRQVQGYLIGEEAEYGRGTSGCRSCADEGATVRTGATIWAREIDKVAGRADPVALAK